MEKYLETVVNLEKANDSKTIYQNCGKATKRLSEIDVDNVYKAHNNTTDSCCDIAKRLFIREVIPEMMVQERLSTNVTVHTKLANFPNGQITST